MRAQGAIAVLIGAAIASSSAPAGAAPASTAAAAQDFALKAVDGRNHRLSEYRGEPVVLTFWGSWCGPCRDSLLTLETMARQGGVPVLGVNLDGTSERASAVSGALHLSYPTLVDVRQQVARAYAVDELPLTLLLDRAGVVRARWSGVPVDAAELSRSLDSLARE
jgi:peroxiredoxin